MEDLAALFHQATHQDVTFQEATEIVRRSSRGTIWIVGGYVFRTLASELYGTPKPMTRDFDFLLDEEAPLVLPPGWTESHNRFGLPKLLGPCAVIDYIPLKRALSITRRGLPPTIDSFFSGAPLTIQSIAVDLDTGTLHGDEGIRALRERTVRVHHADEAAKRAAQTGVTLVELVQTMADSLSFQAILPGS